MRKNKASYDLNKLYETMLGQIKEHKKQNTELILFNVKYFLNKDIKFRNLTSEEQNLSEKVTKEIEEKLEKHTRGNWKNKHPKSIEQNAKTISKILPEILKNTRLQKDAVFQIMATVMSNFECFDFTINHSVRDNEKILDYMYDTINAVNENIIENKLEKGR